MRFRCNPGVDGFTYSCQVRRCGRGRRRVIVGCLAVGELLVHRGEGGLLPRLSVREYLVRFPALSGVHWVAHQL